MFCIGYHLTFSGKGIANPEINRKFAEHSAKIARHICSIAAQSPPYLLRANIEYWSCPFWAQISHISMWFVVNRAAYGESLRLFAH